MDTAIATKFIKTLSVAEAPSRGRVQAPGQGTKDSTPPTDTFKVGTELMHGGQGKLMSTTNLTIITDQRRAFEGDITDTTTFSIRPAVEGLAPPTLEDTNKEVTGDDKKRLRKQNKRRKQHLMAEQAPNSQWTEHKRAVSYESAPLPWTREPYRNSMCPTGRALRHPAANTLREWATFGCPTRTGRNWTKDEIWEVVERGPHRSVTSPEAIEHFAAEIKDKLRTKQARLIAWDDITDNPPPQLKISPIAAIPHKSKAFRSIWICLSGSG